MEQPGNTITDKFSRQRRNLMVMSIVVIVQDLAGLKYEEISVLGNKATIQNPEMVKILLLAFLAYWFCRYIQLFVELGQKGISSTYEYLFKKSLTRSSWYEKLYSETKLKVVSFGSKEKLANPKDVDINCRSLLKPHVKIKYAFPVEGERDTEQHEVAFGLTAKCLFVAFLKLVFVNYRFTEYILPFILFFAAVCSWTLSNWSLLFS